MASFDELVAEKVKLFDSAPEDLANESIKAQRQIFRSIQSELAQLDTDSDNRILPTQANFDRVNTILSSLKNAVLSSDYVLAVRDFIGKLDRSFNISNELAQQINKNFQPDENLQALYEFQRKNAVQVLLGTALESAITQPFNQVLSASISAGDTYANMVRALNTVIEGNDQIDGRLTRYVRSVATTAVAVSDRSYTAAVNEAIGAEWYVYRGGEIETTRPFCEARNGKYFHRKEVESWASLEWDGKIAETDRKTIFNYAGGWNCRHSLIAVTERRVPEDVKQRAREKGYID